MEGWEVRRRFWDYVELHVRRRPQRCKSFSSRLPRGKMERAFTPRSVTDRPAPHARPAAELSNWQRPASLQACRPATMPAR